MNAEQRLEVVSRLQRAELGMIDTKGREYTGGAEVGNQLDTLRNFKSVGERIAVHPLQAWSVYFLKHMDSIMTYVQDVAAVARDGGSLRELSEPIEGRIVDARTYLGLLQCLIDEGGSPFTTFLSEDNESEQRDERAYLISEQWCSHCQKYRKHDGGFCHECGQNNT